jgi:hypothetical protein
VMCWVATQCATWPGILSAFVLCPGARTHLHERTHAHIHTPHAHRHAHARKHARKHAHSRLPQTLLAARCAMQVQRTRHSTYTSRVCHSAPRHPCHICTATGLTPLHVHRDRAHPRHICTATGTCNAGASQTTCARPRRRSRRCRKPRSRCCGTSGPSQRIASRYFSSCRVLVCVAPVHCRASFGHFGGRLQLVPYWCVTMKHGKDSDCYGRLSYYRQHDTVHS